MVKDKKNNPAIEKALKEAEAIFGQPVAFKVRDKDGNLVEATREDIVRAEGTGEVPRQQVAEQSERFKLSVTSDVDGSKTTFSKKKGSDVVYEESYYFSKPETRESENRFGELENSEDVEMTQAESSDSSRERKKLEEELRQKEKEAIEARKRLAEHEEKKDNKEGVFTSHQQILPKK